MNAYLSHLLPNSVDRNIWIWHTGPLILYIWNTSAGSREWVTFEQRSNVCQKSNFKLLMNESSVKYVSASVLRKPMKAQYQLYQRTDLSLRALMMIQVQSHHCGDAWWRAMNESATQLHSTTLTFRCLLTDWIWRFTEFIPHPYRRNISVSDEADKQKGINDIVWVMMWNSDLKDSCYHP